MAYLLKDGRMSTQGKQQPDRGVKHDQGIIRDQLGQEQPVDPDRAQQVNQQDGDDAPPSDMPKR